MEQVMPQLNYSSYTLLYYIVLYKNHFYNKVLLYVMLLL